MSFFWINQSEFEKALQNGFIRADLSSNNHARERILRVKEGDILFSFSKIDGTPVLRAILEALEDAQPANNKCIVKCKYILLEKVYDLNFIVAKAGDYLRGEPETGKYAPIDKNHNRCQGYIYPLDSTAAQKLFDIIEFPNLSNEQKFPDISSPVTRRLALSNRLIRETKLVKEIKSMYKNICQVCKKTLKTPLGEYSEGAHIIPIGAPSHGPDTISNILCLCPNHHVLFDTFSFTILQDGTLQGLPGKIKFHEGHNVSKESLKWHNSQYDNVVGNISSENSLESKI